MVYNIVPYEHVQRAREMYARMSQEHWHQDDLFSPQWWFLLTTTIALLFVWWKLVDKERNHFLEIFSYGLLCSVAACVLDTAGVEFSLWAYPDKLVNMIPPLIPADVIVIPISAMLLYQYFKTPISFILGSIALAAIFAYVVEPLFDKFELFELDHWKHTYSVGGFIAFFLGIRLLLRNILHSLYIQK
ncbi:CBO0543 family protein [Peribacillus sp. SCS-155]|uniref:CBO0543 family protein n=1 Tax=Peribacillus sedimenti TaxID=3115297 RepID=UPI003905B247